MFRSATFKLTIGYLVLVMAISLVFSGVVYHVGTDELERGLNRQTERISNDFPVFNNNQFVQPTQDLQHGARRLLGQLIIFNLLVLISAGFASYYLARRTLKPIEEAHARQSRFTADVSHELRTPITALKIESEVALLDKSISKMELRHVLQSSIEEANKLDALINNLLRLSRLEAGEVRTNFARISIATVIKDSVSHIKRVADNKHISLNVTDLSAGFVTGDRETLVQLVTILLDNAIKFSPKRSTITLSSDSDVKRTLIIIKDEGQGIDPGKLEHVFDRFYQADNARQKFDTAGFGLGLSIAKMIADIHHGSVSLSSRVGKGTTATVRLPVTIKPSK